MSKRPALTFIAAFVLFSVAQAQTHKGVNFQGVIKNPNGTYPNVAGTTATLKILSPNNCILWEEQHSGVNVTDGYINLVVGKGATGGHQPAGQTFQKVYDNATPQTGLTCLNLDGTINGGITSYTPTAQDSRKLRLEMTLPDGPILADFNMRSMPFAVAAENADTAKKIGTKAEADLIVVNSGAGLTQANLEEFIQSLTSVSGGSVRWNGANFISYNPADGANLSVGSVPGSAIASLPWSKLTSIPSPIADISALACVDGKILKKVSGAWACADESGVGSENDPTVAAYAKNAPGTGLTVNGSSQIVPDFGAGAGKVVEGNDSRLSDARTPTGTAGGDLDGSYPNPTLGKIAGTTVTIAALSNGQVLKYNGSAWVNAADGDSLGGLSCSTGDVALYNGSWTCVNASVASSNNSLVRRNGSGQIQSVSADLGSLLLNNGSGSSVTISTPVAFTSYALTLPDTDGDSGQVLTTNGSGGLSWTTPMAASDYLTKAGNLSGLASTSASRTNLGITATGDSLVTAASASAARSAISALSDSDARLAPSPTGNATNYVRVNAGGTAYEARTPANVLSDIGAMAAVTPGTSGNVLTSNGAAWTSAALSVSSGNFSAQNANKVLAGPASGGDAVPTFRALVADDIPNLDGGKITTGTVAAARLPAASGTADGIVNQIAQSFKGAKTFLDAAVFSGSVTAASVAADSISTVNGVKIGTGATTCNGGAAGTVRYNGTSKKIELCDGAGWVVVGSGGGGGAGGCPTNYIPVPALAPYTTSDFCVAKYEMKSVGGTATSIPSKSPWVSITRDDAVTRCQLLGTGYQLISNNQWQTIARNIETVGWNWNGGVAGTNAMSRGHSDNAPASALVADADDNNACVGTGQTCDGSTWNQQRRTNKLTNGEVIWDFAGNVWEWTRDDYVDLGVNPAISAAWNECSALSATNKGLFCSANGAWNSTQGIGQVYGSSAGAVLRGGYWDSGAGAGVFSAALSLAPSGTDTHIGFRCVFVP